MEVQKKMVFVRIDAPEGKFIYRVQVESNEEGDISSEALGIFISDVLLEEHSSFDEFADSPALDI